MPFPSLSSTVVDVYLASAVAAVATKAAFVVAGAAAAAVARSLIAVAARALHEGHARGLLAHSNMLQGGANLREGHPQPSTVVLRVDSESLCCILLQIRQTQWHPTKTMRTNLKTTPYSSLFLIPFVMTDTAVTTPTLPSATRQLKC